MNAYLITAICLLFIVGLAHSTIGEIRIFSRMRSQGRFVPTEGGANISEHQLRILWASWHISTVLAWGICIILWRLSFSSSDVATREFIFNTILLSTFISSLLVLVGTNGKHPGWLGLLGVSILIWIR
ncbi:MAG TPA: hypothetical protein DCY14_05460 [Anaerolineae bacterium]|jgi:hypothetical protein|nr:hypothetical protein [Anaerolineae bacterium]